MKSIRFHPAAVAEAEEAAAWYTSERAGLGSQFGASLEWALSSLQEEPIIATRYPHVSVELNVRRVRLLRFPYDLVFVENAGDIEVLAVAHHRRRPGYWRTRLAT